MAVLANTDAAQACLLARAPVGCVAAEAVDKVGRITISCGIAQARIGADSIETVLGRADAAVYRAKDEGRNQARFADTEFELAPDATLSER